MGGLASGTFTAGDADDLNGAIEAVLGHDAAQTAPTAGDNKAVSVHLKAYDFCHEAQPFRAFIDPPRSSILGPRTARLWDARPTSQIATNRDSIDQVRRMQRGSNNPRPSALARSEADPQLASQDAQGCGRRPEKG